MTTRKCSNIHMYSTEENTQQSPCGKCKFVILLSSHSDVPVITLKPTCLWCCKTLESPLDCKIKPVILKEINTECLLEGLMLKLRLQYFSQLMWRANSLEKTLMLGKTEGRRGWQMMRWLGGWHHRLNGHEFEQAPGDSSGQGSLAFCRHDWATEQQS